MLVPCRTMLRGQRILVVEDSYIVALDLAEALEREGADVVGPVFNLDDAHRLALETQDLDAAVLDVNLRGKMVWPVADILSHRHVRLVFATGYAAGPIKERYNLCQVAEKPTPARAVVHLLSTEQPAAPHGSSNTGRAFDLYNTPS